MQTENMNNVNSHVKSMSNLKHQFKNTLSFWGAYSLRLISYLFLVLFAPSAPNAPRQSHFIPQLMIGQH